MATQKKHKPKPFETSTSTPYKSKTEPTTYFLMVQDGEVIPDDVVIGVDGREYERTDNIPINVDAIPDYVVERLAKNILEMVREMRSDPELSAKMDALIASHKGYTRLKN